MFGPFRRIVPLALLIASLSGAAHAQTGDDPLVVVIESGNTPVDAARIRGVVQAQLGIPVVSILEAMNRRTMGTISVAVTERGRRAAVGFVPFDGTRFAVLVEVRAASPTDVNGEWLAAPIVAAVRTSTQRRAAASTTPEVLDPWLASRVATETQDDVNREVLDPWVGEPRRRVRVRVEVDDYYLGDDIIDPWAEAVSQYQAEQAARLSRPRRTSTPPRRTPPARR